MRAVPALGEQARLVAEYILSKVPGDTTPFEFTEGMYTAMAVLDDNDQFVAGIAFTSYRGFDIHISGATESKFAARPKVVRAVFDYIFNQLGCMRCTAVTGKANLRSRKFLEKLGFALEGTLRLGYDGRQTGLIYGILSKECRHLDGG